MNSVCLESHVNAEINLDLMVSNIFVNSQRNKE